MLSDARARLHSAGSSALGALGYELRRSESLAEADISPDHRALYARVLGPWGAAKPRSVTAEKARERATALRCGG